MQNSLHEILAYILLRSRQISKHEGISKYRITKLVYLCDWCYACAYKHQMTDIQWFFDNFGPFVWDVVNVLNEDPHLFTSRILSDPLGHEITLFFINPKDYNPDITHNVQLCVDYVLNNALNLKQQKFTDLVYATYPIKTSHRYTNLNLVEKANEYRELHKNE